MQVDISVAMIVRNAGNDILRALRSVESVAKQIVVVDTGSEDDTAILATRFGAEVYFFKWNDDFAQARNFAISFAREPWILILDHDEELRTQTLIENLHLFDDPRTGGIRVKIVNHLQRADTQTKTYHTYTRIFRNHPNFRFVSPIHEQIAQSILDSGFEIVDSEITIDHYGYSTINTDKVIRNRKLLEKMLEDNPSDDFTLLHLAEADFSIGKIDTAEPIYEKLLNSFILSEDQLEMVRIRLAQIALKRDQYDKVYQYINNPMSDPHREGLRLMVYGTTLLMQRRYQEALEILTSPHIEYSDMVDKNQIRKTIELINILSNKK